MLWTASVVCFIAALLVTPVVKRFAVAVGAVDSPDARKVHVRIMPRLGGLAIYIAFLIGYFMLQPSSPYATHILVGGFVIILTGALDDRLQLNARLKLMGQIMAAVVVLNGGIRIEFINLPFDQQLYLGWWSVPITFLWIVGITNAVNLIDGLDGLAAGVSSIVLLTIISLAVIQGNVYVTIVAILLLMSTLGFLVHNFYPAKIFMGDTGALFLGYMLGVLSLLGFKNVTLFSLAVPVILLGIPISDTLFAIIRRLLSGQPPFAPDKAHLHHRLLDLGFTMRQAVLVIYGLCAVFGMTAILFSQTNSLGAVISLILLLLVLEVLVESLGLLGERYRPLLNLFSRFNTK
ncbi:glycosyltransferase family 4 protein [Exiguobacterium flavidum]|uniref:glycosyltransferase family 4 protein n=1 Tax=Exiguobacterium flavidum TaxID=2184695 RepID=UPI000DF78367|nr:MraY family glycosyltransferase [Exiguobacterium flavidum]